MAQHGHAVGRQARVRLDGVGAGPNRAGKGRHRVLGVARLVAAVRDGLRQRADGPRPRRCGLVKSLVRRRRPVQRNSPAGGAVIATLPSSRPPVAPARGLLVSMVVVMLVVVCCHNRNGEASVSRPRSTQAVSWIGTYPYEVHLPPSSGFYVIGDAPCHMSEPAQPSPMSSWKSFTGPQLPLSRPTPAEPHPVTAPPLRATASCWLVRVSIILGEVASPQFAPQHVLAGSPRNVTIAQRNTSVRKLSVPTRKRTQTLHP